MLSLYDMVDKNGIVHEFRFKLYSQLFESIFIGDCISRIMMNDLWNHAMDKTKLPKNSELLLPTENRAQT